MEWRKVKLFKYLLSQTLKKNIYLYFRPIDSWKNYFGQDFISCDAEFVQLSSIFANRKIVIYSVMDCEVRDQVVDPHLDCECGQETPNEPPLYFLHYDDIHFASPHYQSIRPKPNFNIKLPTRVNNLVQNVTEDEEVSKFSKCI